MKSKNFKSLLAGIMLLLSLFAVSPFDAGAQGPIKFEYGGDAKIKFEDSKWWLYTVCNEFEGNTCTTKDGATRIEIPKLADVMGGGN